MKKRWFVGLVSVLPIMAMFFIGCDTAPKHEWNADIVIVGSGFAGLAAAVSAVHEGASVIVVEKQAAIGGSSAQGGGAFGATNSAVQKEYGIDDPPSAWLEMFYMRANQTNVKYRSRIFPVESDTLWLIEGSAGMIDWMIDLGMTFGRPRGLELDLAERYHMVNNKGYTGGRGIAKFFSERAEEMGVDIRVNTKAVKVLQDKGPGSRAVGIEVEDGSKIYAKAVILAAGGFASDLGKYFDGVEYSTPVIAMSGDGIEMAIEAGGMLWEEPWVLGMSLAQALTREGLPAVDRTNQGMYVDSSGTRAGFENHNSATQTNYAVTAQKDGGKLFAIISDAHATPTQEQIDSGRVYKGNTLAELAVKAGINGDKLQSEVSAYNEICDAIAALNKSSAHDEAYKGVDPLDIENANSNPNKGGGGTYPTRKTYVKIEGKAFYAVELLPQIAGTFGGVKTKTGTAEVLDKNNLNRVIPGLYAAGENANRNFYDKVYMSGSSTMQAASTGRAAGLAAAAYVAAQ